MLRIKVEDVDQLCTVSSGLVATYIYRLEITPLSIKNTVRRLGVMLIGEFEIL